MRRSAGIGWAAVAQGWAQVAPAFGNMTDFLSASGPVGADDRGVKMERLDPVLLRQLPRIEQVIRDETWYEGERRGCPVAANDPVVREKVSGIILRVGAQWRAELAAEPGLQEP